ncbi:tRNA (adenosine(37)-N6)-threonylcarbamoyltransferase complex ATPase subunit type 1 TsaE [Guggenheimella bovis]
MTFEAKTLEDTKKLAQSFAEKGFHILLLEGDLGVGKTTFVQALAEAMGIKEHIVSPTYSIIKEYDHPVELIHMDLYRILEEEELLAIGFEEYLERDHIVIEWPDIARDLLPEATRMHIQRDGEKRIFTWEEV